VTAPRAGALALALALAGSTAACSDSGAARARVHPTTTAPTPVYVAIGGDETTGGGLPDGIRDAWPQVLYRRLPPGSTFYNLAQRGGLDSGLGEVLSLVAQLRPTLVTVWVAAGRPLASDAVALDGLLRAARRGGAERLLVADTTPAVAAAARRNHATLVSVSGTPTTPAEHAAVASRFAAALR
jgi:hypothetical protein